MSRPPRPAGMRLACAAALLLAAAGLALIPLPGLEGQSKDEQLEKALLRATAKVQGSFSKDLEEVISWAARNGLKAEAEELLSRLEKLDPAYGRLARLRKIVAEALVEADAAALEKLRKTYESRLKTASEAHARRLFGFAANCMKAGLFTRTYDLVQQVLAADPDHKDARRILSFEWDRETKSWITKWETAMKKTHFLSDEGWVAKKDKGNWEKGLRPYLKKWISEEEERRIRSRNEYNPFAVESEHFEVRTNLGRKEAWRFAQMLEDFYGQFFRVFIGFYDQVAGARLLFNQAKLKKKHLVYVFPSREDYLIHIKERHGNSELLRNSAGFYSSADAYCRFYWTEDYSQVLDTFYHEVAHQLFAETKEGSGRSKGNNWLVEGIATYMETWEKADGVWKPGASLTKGNLPMARGFLAENAGWRLVEFVRIDYDQFHKKNRSLNYALSGALCHFFMHYDGEVYKEDFVRFLSAYYGGKVTDGSLADYIKVPGVTAPAEKFALLEKQFREYMAALGSAGEAEEAEEEDELQDAAGG